MKLDKETIIKHRFWFLSGAVVPLALIATLVLIFGVQKAIGRLRSEVEADRDAPGKIKREEVRNQKWKKVLTAQERKVDAVLTEVWLEGWNLQAELVSWPPNIQRQFTSDLFATKVKVSKAEAPQGKNPAPREQGDEGDTQASPEDYYIYRGRVTKVEDQYFDVSNPKPRPGRPPVETFYLTTDTRVTPEGGTEQKVDKFTDKAMIKVRDQVEVTFVRGKFFGDDFIQNEKDEYLRGYLKQVLGLTDYLQNASKQQIVLVKGGMVELKIPGKGVESVPKVFQFKNDWPLDGRPDAESIWFAQEDIWIQREVLRAVQKANQYVSRLRTPEGLTLNPYYTGEGKDDNYYFSNPTWRVTLHRVGNKVTAWLTNISPVPQKRTVAFKVQVTNPADKAIRPRLLEFDFAAEELLAAGDYTKEGITKDLEGEVTGLYAVEQVLQLATAPVKRIDQIVLGKREAHSHRTYKDLRPRFVKDKKEEEKKEEGGDGGGGAEGANRAMQQRQQEQQGALGRRGNNKDEAPLANRYTDATEQFRKMPVAIMLVVDQDSANYVLTALEESRLRFQITQVTFIRSTDKLRPEKKGKGAKPKEEGRKSDNVGTVGTAPQFGGSRAGPPPDIAQFGGGRSTPGPRYSDPRTGGYGSPMGGSPIGGQGFLPPSINQAGGGGAGFAGEQGPTMELVVYGYATIYERYPPKPAAAINAAAATQPAEDK